MLCIHTHRQSNTRKRKHIGPTLLSERFSCALHWEEVVPLHTQQNNQTLRGELFPSIPKDNKGSNRTLLAEQEKKPLCSDRPSEHTDFCEDYMKPLSVRLFEFFKIYNFLVRCHFFWALSIHTSYINIHHKHTRLWWKECWFQTIWGFLANTRYLWAQIMLMPRATMPGSSMFASSDLPERPGGAVVWTWLYWEFPTFPLVMKIQNMAFATLKNASQGKPSNTSTLKTRVWESQLLKNWECCFYFFLKWTASLWLYIIHRVSVYLSLYIPLEASLGSNYKVWKPPNLHQYWLISYFGIVPFLLANR